MTSGEVVCGPGNDQSPIILLADDEVLVRFSTADLLRDEGYVVLEAADGSEALSLLTSGHPLDLVLSDIRMPGEPDGVALTSVIKAMRPSLPVVLVSSHLEPGTAHAADGFLAKPYQPAQLLETVKTMIGTEWQSGQRTRIAS